MYFFPIVIAQKKNQGILDHLRRELEMNVKFTSITNLDYFIKNELKYYEYITHIIVDMGCTDEQGEAFLTEIEALRLSTDVPIIIYAEDKFPGDEVLSTIARKGLANIIGETPKKLKRDSKRRMKDDIREALVKSNPEHPIGLREERQKRFDTTYSPAKVDKREQTAPSYKNINLQVSIGVIGSQHRVGTTTFAMQLADYFTVRGAKVAFMSRNEYTDSDLLMLKETYSKDIKEQGRYFTYRDIDFYAFGREPEDAGVYNVIILEFGMNHKQLDDEFFKCGYRYVVSGFNECDLINTINLLSSQDTTGRQRFVGRDYRIMCNFSDASMCGEQYRYLINEVAPNVRTSFNLHIPYKFALPDAMIKRFDEEFLDINKFVKGEMNNATTGQ
ncbi:MAG: hypothetical protein J6D27_09545 [Ruminiclostridium sp.]|nr:hypothetical protein [Ruminiclostridium sp.]